MPKAKTTPTDSAAPEEAVTRDYEVMSPLNHDGVDYAIGTTVALTLEQADFLAARGVVAAPAATDVQAS